MSRALPGYFSDNGMDTDEGDDDFLPPDDQEEEDEEMTAEDDDLEATALNDGEEEEDEEVGEDETVQVAIDPRTHQIIVVDANGNPRPRMAALQALLQSRFGAALVGRGGGRTADADDEDDSDYYPGSRARRDRMWAFPTITEPVQAGLELGLSGQFGRIPQRTATARRKYKAYSRNLADITRKRSTAPRRTSARDLGDSLVPNTAGCEVVRLDANVYCGQYSDDGSFFYTASQDFRIRIYKGDTPVVSGKAVHDDVRHTTGRRWGGRYGSSGNDRSSMKLMKSIQAHDAYSRWTTTDASLAPDNNSLIYSSISPVVNFVRTRDNPDGTGLSGVAGFAADASEHVQLNFSDPSSIGGFGIWSIRFSADAREIVAGASRGGIYLYDIESRRSVLRIRAHMADVNAVCFADKASSNVLVSGSDDATLKVWDRRSLSGEKPSGVLVGHTEGVTHMSPKGDGRYVISNGKDQTCKLWDLRNMRSSEDYVKLTPRNVGISDFDYRDSYYPKPRYDKHPNDGSVMTYTGHTVLQTLIRCHFSPEATTGQQYIYSGSTDGRIHIWGLDGRIVQVLDRRQVMPLINNKTGAYNDPCSAPTSAPGPNMKGYGGGGCTVRDVSWHPYEPTILASAWEGRMSSSGSVSMHSWRPHSSSLSD